MKTGNNVIINAEEDLGNNNMKMDKTWYSQEFIFLYIFHFIETNSSDY